MLPTLNNCDHLRKLTPKEARQLVQQVAVGPQTDVPVVLKLLESSSVACAEITYGYGDLVVDNGIFRLPGTQAPISRASSREHCTACVELQTKFNPANPVPLLLNVGFNRPKQTTRLNRTLEVFRLYTDVYEKTRGYRAVPIAYRGQGELIGLFENLRPPLFPARYGSFYVSAGSRNAHLLLPLHPDDSNLLDVAHLLKAFPDSSGHIREVARTLDVEEYGLPNTYTAPPPSRSPAKRVKLSGMPSDWRIIRTIATDWRASLLMLLIDSSSVLESTETALALFRAGFYQLQDALAAFTAEGPTHESDTEVFMNLGKASVPAAWNHLCGCSKGEQFVHVVAGSEDSKGPWPEAFKKMSRASRFEHEIKDRKYFPMILEPAKLSPSSGPGFVSYVHHLIPQPLFLDERPNAKWVENSRFPERLERRHLAGLAKEYPRGERKKAEERIADLRSSAEGCWPNIAKTREVLHDFYEITPEPKDAMLSRATCLGDFMTVRYKAEEDHQNSGGQTAK